MGKRGPHFLYPWEGWEDSPSVPRSSQPGSLLGTEQGVSGVSLLGTEAYWDSPWVSGHGDHAPRGGSVQSWGGVGCAVLPFRSRGSGEPSSHSGPRASSKPLLPVLLSAHSGTELCPPAWLWDWRCLKTERSAVESGQLGTPPVTRMAPVTHEGSPQLPSLRAPLQPCWGACSRGRGSQPR